MSWTTITPNLASPVLEEFSLTETSNLSYETECNKKRPLKSYDRFLLSTYINSKYDDFSLGADYVEIKSISDKAMSAT